MSRSRYIKCGCVDGCGCTFRMARTWIDRAGALGLRCPSCGGAAHEGDAQAPARTGAERRTIERICEDVVWSSPELHRINAARARVRAALGGGR